MEQIIMMRAVTFDPSLDRFVSGELSIPEPFARQVSVRVEACGLNPVDAKVVNWKAMVPEMGSDWVCGLDVSGVVEACGAEVTRWKPGDRVLCHGNMLLPHGGFAEVSLQDESVLLKHPRVDPAVAASVPCAGWTAWRALIDKLRLEPSDSLLIVGATGGVGTFAVQIARHLGVETIIAVCSGNNLDYARRLGATDVIDYRTESVVERTMAITGGAGVRKALDAVGPDNDLQAAEALAYEGQLLELVSTVRPESYRDAFGRGLTFHQLSLGSGHRYGERGKSDLVRAGQAFCALLESGAIKVPELREIPLGKVPETLEGIRERRTVGKIVARVR